MKTKTITLYSFDELSDDAKEKAIDKLYNLNVDYEWWDSTFDDAKRIGLEIRGFGCEDDDHSEYEDNDDEEQEYYQCICCGWTGDVDPGSCPRCTGMSICGVY